MSVEFCKIRFRDAADFGWIVHEAGIQQPLAILTEYEVRRLVQEYIQHDPNAVKAMVRFSGEKAFPARRRVGNEHD